MLFTVRQRVISHNSQRGQGVIALLWVLAWLAGLAAITYWCVARSVPAIEQKVQQNVEAAIAPVANSSVRVSIDGRMATVEGKLSNEDERQRLLAAGNEAPGLAKLIDKLIVPAAMKTISTDNNEVVQSAIANDNLENSENLSADSESSDSTAVATAESDLQTNDAAKDNNIKENAVESGASLVSTEKTGPTVPTVDTNSSAVVTTVQAAQATTLSLTPPKLRLLSQEDTLTFTGNISKDDDLLQLIQLAMNTFDAAYVVNSVQLDDETAKADWLPELVDFLPQLNILTDAGVEIVSSQITLSGIAQSEEDHDNVINQALTALSTFSLVERISITPSDKSSTDKLDASKATTANATTAKVDTAKVTNSDDGPAARNSAQGEISSQPVTQLSELSTNSTETATTSVVEKILADARAEVSGSVNTDTTAAVRTQANSTTPAITTAVNETLVNEAPINEASADTNESPASKNAQRQALKTEFDALENTRILFESGSNVLTEPSREIVETLAKLFNKYPQVPIEIDGHTDSSGNTVLNLSLSQKRANAVRDLLVELGVSVFRISAYGFGDGVPIADNDTDAGRRLNRRIEFLF